MWLNALPRVDASMHRINAIAISLVVAFIARFEFELYIKLQNKATIGTLTSSRLIRSTVDGPS